MKSNPGQEEGEDTRLTVKSCSTCVSAVKETSDQGFRESGSKDRRQ